MSAILIPNVTPSYIALSTDVSGSKIDGVSVVGATVFLTDTEEWKIVLSDLTLSNFELPVSITTGDIEIGAVEIKDATTDARATVSGSALYVDVRTAVQPTGLSTVACGELSGSAAALQMPSVACKYVKFKAVWNNAGNVYVWGASVTKVDGTTDTTTGFELGASEETGWLPATNMNLFYRICDNAGDDLTYIALT